MAENLKVIELFAGVGGFRLGLERVNAQLGQEMFETVWNSQYEPSTNIQHASQIYQKNFGSEGHCNRDIEDVIAFDFKQIPDHDMLVGGFPCQDYSVARSLDKAAGLVGKKGVLWWSIHSILNRKKKKPKYLLLENVDRLLKSPASQRGRDFAVMLASLSDLGYAVEWRVINAGDYGYPQKRRRVFILGYHKSTEEHAGLKKDEFDWLTDSGVMAESFPANAELKSWPKEFELEGDLGVISTDFNKDASLSPFYNAGSMIDRTVRTIQCTADYSGKRTVLEDILLDAKKVPKEYWISTKDYKQWEFLKGAKSITRQNKNTGHKYSYSEGAIAFPDHLDKPSRTIITGEGGRSPSRTKHVVSQNGKLRRLTPIELERLNMFPDDHTAGVVDGKRAFLMGNALVVGVVERIGKTLSERILNPITV